MNKKLAAALSGGAVLVMALTGCSSGGGTKDNKELDAWAKKVCDAVPAQDAKIKAANASIAEVASNTSNPPATIQKTDSQAFQDMSDGYKTLATAISGAGAPPGVDGGSARQKDAVKNLNDLSGAYADLKKKVDALDTKNQAKFATGLHDIATQMTALEAQNKSGTAALKNLEQGDVKDAIAKQPSCQKVAASASATQG
ncbi:small secreted protein [Streptomyces sp. NPDC047000]|uniref:small secreted protein n=1 Tax=Streptomyces sp. NPDC047000 TaxID=3155474 RepID=UPI0033C6D1F8